MNIIEQEAKKIVSKIDFSQLRNKKVLITGASGLIGIYLVACLKHVKQQYNIEIHRWTHGNSPMITNEAELSIANIEDETWSHKYSIPKILNDEYGWKFDVIIHAAGYAQPNKFLENKDKTIEINTTGTMALFKLLKPDGKFLFISSSEIYSGNDSENITEEQIGNTNTNHPRASYIEGKRCGEAICYAYKEKGYDVKIIRLSLAYGAGTKKGDTRVMHSLIDKALNNDVIEMMDDGSAIRTYCYITDVVEMLFNILLHGKETIYNVSGKSRISIFELAKLIGIELNKSISTPLGSNSLTGSPKVVNISNERYLKEFNKTYFVSLEEGIKNVIEWQKQL